LLVPDLPARERPEGRVTSAALQQRETETVRRDVTAEIDRRRPLGTTCVVNWAHYKTVRVTARVVVRREEDRDAVERRVLARLHQVINPLPAGPEATGWPFGQALRSSHVNRIVLAEPGVLWMDQLRLEVQEVPEKDVASIAADAFQPHTWYAGSGDTLFRSLDDGEGWEPVGHYPGEQIEVVCTHPDRAGILAVATVLPEQRGSRIHISTDCGESWEPELTRPEFRVRDIAWMVRGDTSVLLLATDVGLYELALQRGSSPVQVLVEPRDQDMGFYAVVASKDVRGQVSVAVAAQETGGVYLSSEGSRPDTFRHIGLKGRDIRVLAVQYDGPRSFLWAGAYAAGGDPGEGCFRWELIGAEDPPEGWQPYGRGWGGGSCRAIAFTGPRVMAASYRDGVVYLPSGRRDAKWQVPDFRCGLPQRGRERFLVVETVATGRDTRRVMTGGTEGVFCSEDGGENYISASNKAFLEKVTLPPTWLFCSGEHEIRVVSEDEASRD
jgi:hypothetical protein